MRGHVLTLCSLSLAVLACGDPSSRGHLPDAPPPPADAAIDATSTFTLTVTRDGNGTGTVASTQAGVNCGDDCSAAYEVGATVTLTATADPGATFVGWSGACTGTGTCTVTITEDTELTASFALDHSIVITRAGNGSGTVTSAPAAIDCGTTCAASFGFGTVVTLTAKPATGSTFTGWSGGGCTGTGTCVATMTEAVGVTATFTL